MGELRLEQVRAVRGHELTLTRAARLADLVIDDGQPA
jgi:hypothetical protein